MNNPFFKNQGTFKIDKLLKLAGIKNNNKFNDLKKILEENFPKKIRHYEN